MIKTETYNGWANYETWRVHLEFFEGMDPHELRDQLSGMSLYEIGQHAKDTVAQFIDDTIPDKNNRGQLTPEGMCKGWALAFTDGANWREIAEHLAEAAGIDPRQ